MGCIGLSFLVYFIFYLSRALYERKNTKKVIFYKVKQNIIYFFK